MMKAKDVVEAAELVERLGCLRRAVEGPLVKLAEAGGDFYWSDAIEFSALVDAIDGAVQKLARDFALREMAAVRRRLGELLVDAESVAEL